MAAEKKKTNAVRKILRDMGSVVIAFSGGVDSSLLSVLAQAELEEKVLAITTVSPSIAAVELEEAKNFARLFGIRHLLMDARELEDPRYAENTPLRCYWCKHETYQILARYARENGFAAVVDGTNFDDTRDDRPGRQAAKEYGVRSPFVETEMTKPEIRAAAQELGLPNWDKPAKACLASRVPYGTPVTPEVLRRVEQAEEILCRMGIRQYRVRHHQDAARIEVLPEDFPRIISHAEEILTGFRELGYRHVTLDLAGYRPSGMKA